LVDQQHQWYGLDPVHIRRGVSARAWRDILAGLSTNGHLPDVARGSFRRWLYLKLLAPERRWLFGREQQTSQPAGRLVDGTTLAFY
jgi:hypothetical protein